MPEEYMDKYSEELLKARKEARSIPTELENQLYNLIFLGAIQTARGNEYYYRGDEGEYYYDTDSSRKFREQFKKNRIKRYAKK